MWETVRALFGKLMQGLRWLRDKLFSKVWAWMTEMASHTAQIFRHAVNCVIAAFKNVYHIAEGTCYYMQATFYELQAIFKSGKVQWGVPFSATTQDPVLAAKQKRCINNF